MQIRVIRKKGSKKWHISYADGGSPSCINTPLMGDENTYFVNTNKTIAERILVLEDLSDDAIYDPDDLCGKCKKTLVSRIRRQNT